MQTEDPDDDNDGIPDLVENASGSDPLDPTVRPAPRFYVGNRNVPPGGDGSRGHPFHTIQAAINAADMDAYDIIEVGEGVYAEAIQFNGKKVQLHSQSGAEATYIVGGAARGVEFNGGQLSQDGVKTPWLEGFTIKDGAWGGIGLSPGSAPMIVNCVLTNNGAFSPSGGGGVYCPDAHPTLVNCTLVNNGGSTVEGGGLFCDGDSTPLVTHCTFSGNLRATDSGQIRVEGNAQLFLHNSIVWSGATDEEIAIDRQAEVHASYSNIRGSFMGELNRFPGYLNHNADPLMEPSGRLTLNGGSIDVGTPLTLGGFNHLTRYDADGEARVLTGVQSPSQALLFPADIGSDVFVYYLAFPPDGATRRYLDANEAVVEESIVASEVDEASGVAFLGLDGSNRSLIAVVDDEEDDSLFVYTIGANGTGIFNPQHLELERMGADLEGITYDAANNLLYVNSSHVRRNRYRNVEPTLLSPLTHPPVNDYQRNRCTLLTIPVPATFVFPDPIDNERHRPDVNDAFPQSISQIPSSGFMAFAINSLNVQGPNRAIPINRTMVVYSTVRNFGKPADGQTYLPGATIPGGGIVLGESGVTTGVFNHDNTAMGTTYYYKMWVRKTALPQEWVEGPEARATSRNYPTLHINEMSPMATPGWVELYNPGSVAVSLSGYTMTYQDNFGANSAHTFVTSPPSVAANARRILTANGGTSGANMGFTMVPAGSGLFLDAPSEQEIDKWRYEAFPEEEFEDATSYGRTWDGGPSGRRARPAEADQLDVAVPYQPNLPTTFATDNHAAAKIRLVAGSMANGQIRLRWNRTATLPPVWLYSPKQYDGFPINVEGIAYRSPTEMILGLRSPLSQDRGEGPAYYYVVNDVDDFLPDEGWSAGVPAAGVTGPFTMDLDGQGIRGIEWCPDLGLNSAQQVVSRYLLIGGPADGGPVEQETGKEVFSLWSWQGPGRWPATRPCNCGPEALRCPAGKLRHHPGGGSVPHPLRRGSIRGSGIRRAQRHSLAVGHSGRPGPAVMEAHATSLAMVVDALWSRARGSRGGALPHRSFGSAP